MFVAGWRHALRSEWSFIIIIIIIITNVNHNTVDFLRLLLVALDFEIRVFVTGWRHAFRSECH